jgi:hypothetical protein
VTHTYHIISDVRNLFHFGIDFILFPPAHKLPDSYCNWTGFICDTRHQAHTGLHREQGIDLLLLTYNDSSYQDMDKIYEVWHLEI